MRYVLNFFFAGFGPARGPAGAAAGRGRGAYGHIYTY